jgi:hypothetical protein
MKSSKWMFGLMAIVLVMAFSSSSFAQVQIQLFNTPSPGEIQTNHNAQTADPTSVGAGLLVSGSVVAFSTLTTTQLTLTFPAPITSSTALNDGTAIGTNSPAAANIPAADPIAIVGSTGLFASVTAVATVNYQAGTILINLPGFPACAVSTANCAAPGGNSVSGSFRIIGVRLEANGKTAPLNVTAALSSSANNYINTTTPTAVISSLGAGIGSLTQSSVGTLANQGTTLIFTNTTGALAPPSDLRATFTLNEGFAAAWRTATQSSASGNPVNNGTQIALTIAGLPAGVTAAISQNLPNGSVGGATPTITFLTNPNIGGCTGFTVAVATCGGFTSASATEKVDFTATSLTTVEQLSFDLALSGTPTGTLSAATITITATMAPTSTSAFASSGIPSASGGYPKFATANVGPLTIGNIVAANTTLLIPYVVKSGAYDTGIAIANTTADPFGASGGGATPTAGNIVFTLFPRNAAGTGADPSFTVTTSATVRPGVGLATDGTLAAGGLWTGLATDLMTAAGKTGDFFGYIFIQTNFLDAHGASFIFDGKGFTSASPVLVLFPPAGTPRNGNVESLNN